MKQDEKGLKDTKIFYEVRFNYSCSNSSLPLLVR